MLRKRGLALVVGFWSFIAAGCSEESISSSGAVEAMWSLPADVSELSEETFFDQPFPSDARKVDGHVRVSGWPNPKAVPILAQYIDFIDGRLTGFSPVAAGFLRFSSPLDPASLPDAASSLSPEASVQLIDVDPDSPEYGQRRPIYVTFRKEAGVYWQPNTLSFMPVPGFPMRPSTRYALVVTDAAVGEGNKKILQNSTLKALLGLASAPDGATSDAQAAFAPAVAELSGVGIDVERVVHFTAFTTDDPTEELRKAAESIEAQIEAPTADAGAWKLLFEGTSFDEYEGSYGPLPNFQEGTLPFEQFGDGGGFLLDESGVPQVVDTYEARFSLAVPKAEDCPMPPNGYPIVMYAHGTTGDYRSYVFDGTARALALRCIASMGVDQILHGTRPGAPDDDISKQVLFFNFNNIEAARTNVRQSGLDEVQRARLFTESDMRLPASVSLSGTEVRFDASKLMFFGHSQGSLNGPLFLASSAAPRGAVFSGASGVMQITLLEKTKPEPSVANLVKTIFLQLLQDEQDEVSLLYPPIALAQTIVDPVDPMNYARLIALEPEFGAPKSVYMTEGVGPDGQGDSYAPPRGCEALAMAMGLPLMSPVVHPFTDAVAGTPVEVTVGADGLSGNIAGGAATGILAQWQPDGGDGHFVVFDIDAAKDQAAGFLRNLADDPVGRVPAP
ncbi:MAG: hypothetical protein JNK04_08705 [Myxococcales bacterium]|nr:hypothetical protein [Myxococcales bacterium]